MSYPTVPIKALSEDAQMLYALGLGSGDVGMPSLKIDRDWLAAGSSRLSEHAFRPEHRLDPKFTPNAKLAAALEELVAAGFGWWQFEKKAITLHRLEPEYTIAQGEGGWNIEVSLVKRPGNHANDGSRLAILNGADLQTSGQTSGFTELQLKVAVPGATDCEHDPAYAAQVIMMLPTFPQIYGTQLTFYGVATEVYLYPFGTKPTLREEAGHYTKLLTEPLWCESETCQGGQNQRSKHVFAPYLPPKLEDLTGQLLCVRVRPATTSSLPGEEPS